MSIMRKKLKRLKEIKKRSAELRALDTEDFTDDLMAEMEELIEERDKIERVLTRMNAASDDDSEDGEISDPETFKFIRGLNSSSQSESRGGPCGADRSYRGMFYRGEDGFTLSRGGFRDGDEFLDVLHSGRYSEKLVRASMNESVNSEGGFSVPEEFAAQWLDDSLESEIVRPRAQIWNMNAPTRKVPGWDGNDRSGGKTHGGLEMQWLAEKATGTRQSAKMRMIELKAKKGAIFSQISNELAADGQGFESQFTGALVKSIGFGLDEKFLFGTGAGVPAGALSSANPALVSVAKESGQTAATITYTNLVSMFSRIAPMCLGNVVWLANATAIPQLLTLTIAVGTGGSHFPVMKETNGQFSIFGKPVIFTEHAKSLGTEGDIALVDFSQYTIGLRKEISIDKSTAPGWTEDLTDYRVIIRIDGQSTWSAPITPKNGDSLSWAVTLAERS